MDVNLCVLLLLILLMHLNNICAAGFSSVLLGHGYLPEFEKALLHIWAKTGLVFCQYLFSVSG